MRRGLSIAVLAVLLSGFLVPLAQGSDASLPACCRAHGAHHCMGMTGMDGFHSAASKCPYRAEPAVISGIVALVGFRMAIAVVAAEPNSSIRRASLLTSAEVAAVPQRGPPQAQLRLT